jgi:hypothetical protein
VDLARPVDASCVKQDALGCGRLSRIDVGDDPDVAGFGERRLGIDGTRSGCSANAHDSSFSR